MFWVQNFSKGRFAFYALFDGHAGEHAADYCEKNFVLKFVEVSRKCMIIQLFMMILFIIKMLSRIRKFHFLKS